MVIAKEGREETNLISAYKKLAIRASDETTDIATHKRFARQSQRREHRHIERQRFPGAVAVARPHRRVALNAGITRARNYKRPALRLQSRQTFISSARHQQREDIAILCVSRLFAFIIANDIHLVLA